MLKGTLYLETKCLVIWKVWIQDRTDKPVQGCVFLAFALTIVYPGYFPSSEKTRIPNVSNHLISSCVCSGLFYSPVFQVRWVCKHKSVPAIPSATSVTEGIMYSFAKRLPALVRRGAFSVHFGSARESKGSKLSLLDVIFRFYKMSRNPFFSKIVRMINIAFVRCFKLLHQLTSVKHFGTALLAWKGLQPSWRRGRI